MKTLAPLLIFFFAVTNIHSQTYEWAFGAGHSAYAINTSIKKDHVGNIYYSSFVDSNGTVLKTEIEMRDRNNISMWTKVFISSAVIKDIEINSINDAVVTGYYSGSIVIGIDTLRSGGLYNSAFIFEVNSSGLITWARNFNPEGNDFKPQDMYLDKNDNIFMTANIQSQTHGWCSFHKLDLWGFPLINKFYTQTENKTFSHIYGDSLGNIYVSGTCGQQCRFDTITTSQEPYQNVLIKYNTGLIAQWVIERPYITFDDNNGLSGDGRNLYWTFVQKFGNFDSTRLIKTDFNGTILIDKQGPLPGAFFPSIISSTDNYGNTVVICNIYLSLFIYRYDSQFNVTWSDTIRNSISGSPLPVQVQCYDSCFYIASRFSGDSVWVGSNLLYNQDTTQYGYDFFITKVNYDNYTGISSIENNTSLKIYPNPSDGNFIISNENHSAGELQIYDLTGKELFKQSFKSEGLISINLKDFSRGCYLIKYINQKEIRTTKLIIEN